VRDVAKVSAITYDDVTLDESRTIVLLRKLQDALLAAGVLDGGSAPIDLGALAGAGAR